MNCRNGIHCELMQLTLILNLNCVYVGVKRWIYVIKNVEGNAGGYDTKYGSQQ